MAQKGPKVGFSGIHSQQDPAGLTVDPSHGIVVGDGFLPEIHDLHREKFLKTGKKFRNASLGKINSGFQKDFPQKSQFPAVVLIPECLN